MPRGDLIVKLVRAAVRGEVATVRKVTEAIIAEERAKHHHVLADKLLESLQANGTPTVLRPELEGKLRNLFHEVPPRKSLDDLILSPVVRQTLDELVEEHHRKDLLRSYGLEPRHRILLVGPPGNGKTSVAEALAYEIGTPFFVASYEGIIGSYLGETASKLKQLLDYVRSYPCVLFFDEFDVLGKERGDAQDTGEIKRVVSSLLLQMDALPSHVIVVTASNHPELLDKAVWRRFQVCLELGPPGPNEVRLWLERFLKVLNTFLLIDTDQVAHELEGLSYAELEEFGADVRRRFVLEQPLADPVQVFKQRLALLKYTYRPGRR